MIFIFAAPSGSGKSTLINYLLSIRDDLEFSVSATTRAPRGTEQNGKEYYFLSTAQFEQLIAQDALIEYEKVYSGTYYGTLKSEIERINSHQHHILFDLDVQGAIHLKKIFGNDAYAIFIAPPSVEELNRRLHLRGTDREEKIEERIKKAAIELEKAPLFDIIIRNDNLETAKKQLREVIENKLKTNL